MSSRFFVWPTFAFLLAFFVLSLGGADHVLSLKLFEWEGHHWALKDSPLLTVGFHQGGKLLSVAGWLACCAIYAVRQRHGADWREPGQQALLLLILSVAVTTAFVSVAKTLTHMDCPWDLQGLGGRKVYVPLLQVDHVNAARGACFPAGQASAGYAWVALFFAASVYRPRWRRRGLLAGLAFGAVLGVAQQLRGAHFLSHDLTSAWISWIVAAAVHGLLVPGIGSLRFYPAPELER